MTIVIRNTVKKIFFISILTVAIPSVSQARETSLGSFSTEDVQKIIGSPICFHIQDKKVSAGKETLLNWIKIRPALSFNPNYRSEIENINFYPADRPGLKIYYRFLNREQERYHIKISTSLAIKEEELKSYLNKVREKTRVAPQNARLVFEEKKVSVFSLSKDGYEIATKESGDKIINALKDNPFQKDIKLPVTTLEPEVSSENIERYGIKELIGTGTSNFRGSPRNRIHNIRIGASKFNGVLIKPGEEFSFVKTVGPIDASAGYLPELVIKPDKTIPEYGGGMCQISTTMFRAAINSGLKITARTPHAYPVHYYNPQGLDATVYIPSPDLKFINDTPSHILIQSRIQGAQISFDFYGTSDGRQVKILGPYVTARGEAGAMKTVVYQEVYDKDGNLIRKDTFKSSYDSPENYPHSGEEKILEKPDGWSKREWKEYKKAHGL